MGMGNKDTWGHPGTPGDILNHENKCLVLVYSIHTYSKGITAFTHHHNIAFYNCTDLEWKVESKILFTPLSEIEGKSPDFYINGFIGVCQKPLRPLHAGRHLKSTCFN